MAARSLGARDAEHHVQHIIDSVSGEHRQRMQEALVFARAGKLHDAEHEIEHMLAGPATPGLTLPQLHLRAAVGSIRAGDPRDAEHHMGHFVETAAGPEREKGQQALEVLRRGELHQAEHEIEDLLPGR